jgi:hypothetical protein
MFTAKMARLAFDAESRRRMGANARQAAQAYAIERTTAMMLERYRAVIEDTAPRRKGWRARWNRWLDRVVR